MIILNKFHLTTCYDDVIHLNMSVTGRLVWMSKVYYGKICRGSTLFLYFGTRFQTTSRSGICGKRNEKYKEKIAKIPK